jgi:hypothetical protein
MKLPVARTLSVLLLIATLSMLPGLSHAQTRAPQAQDAEVTFYSNGSLGALLMPKTKHAAFAGYIFDGENRLFTTWHDRFVTLRLPPGVHMFSASYSHKHPARNSQFSLNLVAGQSYFIRAEAEVKGVVILQFQKGRLDVVSCQTAHHDAGQDKPVQTKHIAPGARSEVVALTSMPPCQ